MVKKPTYEQLEQRIRVMEGELSEHRELKQTLLVAEKALKESENRYRTLIEESFLAVSFIDREGRYQYVSPRFTEMFGYSLEDIPTGKEWFRKAHPDPAYRHQAISTWIDDKRE